MDFTESKSSAGQAAMGAVPALPASAGRGGHGGHAHRPQGRHRVAITAAVILGLAGAVIGGRYWVYARDHEDTDDAFIDTHVILISPKVDGPAVKVYVDDNQQVKAGDALVDLDPTD